uniref:Uncharacterized protein n=1 Tax=Moniliophthora roreri TaxID=221103 RepID=A0A0W0G4P3_MONRR
MSHSFGLAESLTLNYIYMARHHHHEIHGTTALVKLSGRNLNPQLNCINWINTIVIPNPNSGFSLRPRSAAIGMIDRRRGLVTTVRQILVTDVPNSQDSNYPTFRLKKDRRKAACNVMLQIRIRDTVKLEGTHVCCSAYIWDMDRRYMRSG